MSSFLQSYQEADSHDELNDPTNLKVVLLEKIESSVIIDYVHVNSASPDKLQLSWSSECTAKNMSFENVSTYMQDVIMISITAEFLEIDLTALKTIEEVNIRSAIIIQAIYSQVLLYNPKNKVIQRVAITGIAGWSAQFLFQELLRRRDDDIIYDIYGVYHSATPLFILPSKQHQCDLADSNAVEQLIDDLRPDVFVHLAAISSPVKCHQNPEQAYATNAPQHLLSTIKTIVPNCLFIFASTDMVYDGEHAPYLPSDPCSPVNHYGRSKLVFEQQVKEQLRKGVILRLSNMLGASHVYQPAGEKFLQFLFNAFSRREYVGLKADEKRSFVYVGDVVQVILSLMVKYAGDDDKVFEDRCKTWNVGGRAGMSRLELAQKLAVALRCNIDVHKSKQNDFAAASMEEYEKHSWTVYSMCSMQLAASTNNPQINNNDFSMLASPRDISMVVTDTELLLGRPFADFEQYCTYCLKVI